MCIRNLQTSTSAGSWKISSGVAKAGSFSSLQHAPQFSTHRHTCSVFSFPNPTTAELEPLRLRWVVATFILVLVDFSWRRRAAMLIVGKQGAKLTVNISNEKQCKLCLQIADVSSVCNFLVRMESWLWSLTYPELILRLSRSRSLVSSSWAFFLT